MKGASGAPGPAGVTDLDEELEVDIVGLGRRALGLLVAAAGDEVDTLRRTGCGPRVRNSMRSSEDDEGEGDGITMAAAARRVLGFWDEMRACELNTGVGGMFSGLGLRGTRPKLPLPGLGRSIRLEGGRLTIYASVFSFVFFLAKTFFC
jgi:hypothetical protein